MAEKIWLSGSTPVAQISTYTPASVTIGNIFTLTVNGKTLSFTATANTVANVVTGLKAALDATTIAELLKVTWEDATTLLRGTASEAGKPFTITSSSADGAGSAGHSFTAATPTVSKGPNHWDDTQNWSGGSLPIDADEVIIEANIDILYGLDQSGIQPASLTIPAAYTAKIGLPKHNGSYAEYLETYLKIGPVLIVIGEGEGQGSGRIKINTGTDQTELTVLKSATGELPGIPAICWKGTHAANVVQVSRGSFGAAFFGGEDATIVSLYVGYVTSKESDARVVTGTDLTLGAIVKTGGILTVNSDFTSIVQDAGTTRVQGDDADITTVTINGGTFFYDSDGTITTMTGSGIFDFRGGSRACIVTNATMYPGYELWGQLGRVTFSNGVDFVACEGDKYHTGKNVNLAVTAA